MDESQANTAPQFFGFVLVPTSQNDGGRIYKHTTNQEELLLPSSIVLPAGFNSGGKYQDIPYRKAAVSCVRKRFDRGLEHQSHVFEQSTYGEFSIVVLDLPAILPDKDYIMQLAMEKRRLCLEAPREAVTTPAFVICPKNAGACGGGWWKSLKSDIDSICYDITEHDERFYFAWPNGGNGYHENRQFCFNAKRPETIAKRKANRVTKPKIRRVHCWRHVDAFCDILSQTFWNDYRVNITLNGTKIEKMRSFGNALAFLRRAKRNLDRSYLDKLRCYGYYRDGDRNKLDADCAFEEVSQAKPNDETERLFQRHVNTLRSMFHGHKATGKRRRKQSPRKGEHR